MNKLSIYAFLLVSLNGFCQKIDKEFITGTWKVVKIEKVSNNPNFKDLIKSFKLSIFYFKDDETFEIETKNKTQLFSMMTRMFNKSNWKIGKLNEILVGTEKDRFSIMLINVVLKNNEIFFDLSEEDQFPLVLKVEKIKE
ncbi:MAG: hypothetical protein NWQ17_10105 [Polaribacter sp.]|nr:hypothetical protein [Polaribacter sp.]